MTTPARPLVLGVDSSTQSTKVEARELETGTVVARASSSHPPTTPPVSEHDPAVWWSALVDACEQLEELRSDVVAISVAGQQHGLVLLDEDGQSLRPAKLWNDTTSARQATELEEAFGAPALAELTGSVPVASFTISKLALLAANEPEVIGRIARIMLPHDYLTWKMTGAQVTDRGDASGTGWFNPRSGAYVPELLSAVAPQMDWQSVLPTVLGPTTPAATLQREAATALGLSASTVVGPGTGDNMGGALGLGLDVGDIVMSLGTSGVAYAVSETPTCDPTGRVAGFADATGHFLPLVCTLNATKVTDTVAQWLGLDAAGLAELAMEAKYGDRSPVVVPYFDGERTPNLPDATGSILGLTTATTAEELALAAHDGVLCGLLDGVDALSKAGVRVDGQLLLVGGGSRSMAYRQRLADLWGDFIVVPNNDEIVAAGAAVQAAAVATTQSLRAIQDSWDLKAGETVHPRSGAQPDDIRTRYREAAQKTT